MSALAGTAPVYERWEVHIVDPNVKLADGSSLVAYGNGDTPDEAHSRALKQIADLRVAFPGVQT